MWFPWEGKKNIQESERREGKEPFSGCKGFLKKIFLKGGGVGGAEERREK